MKALIDHAEFISDNVWKFHSLLKDHETNKEKLEKQVENFTSELYNRAGECIGVSTNILNDPNIKSEIIVALFMQASELWRMFCKKYKETYPSDPPYFYEDEILKSFESAYKKGWLFNNESAK